MTRTVKSLSNIGVGLVALLAAMAVVYEWNAERPRPDGRSSPPGWVPEAQRSQGPPPHLVVVVRTRTAGAPPPGTVRVSNLESINVDVSLESSRFPLEQLHMEASVQTLEISVRELPSRRVAPIRVWQMGTGGIARSQSATLIIEVPLDSALARKRIEEALLAAENDEEQRIAAGKANPNTLERFRTHRDEAVSLFQQEYFHESRTGFFEIQAFYRSSAEGFWNGAVASDSVPFEIVYEGDYLQKHGFR